MEHLLDILKFFPEAFEGQGSQFYPFFHDLQHLIDGIKTAFDCMKLWCKHVNLESLIIVSTGLQPSFWPQEGCQGREGQIFFG